MWLRLGALVPALWAVVWCVPASLAAQGLEASDDSPFEAHVQSTLVNQQKNDFRSAYAGTNSLRNKAEGGSGNSYTSSATAFLGLRLGSATEFYYNPEVFEGIPFNRQLVGLGGFQNGELQKGSYTQPAFYNARAFFRHTIGLGGGSEHQNGDINKLSGQLDANRIEIYFGKVATLDFFDHNTYSHDGRYQFMNFAIFSMGAYSYSADTKGYSYGGVVEWYQNDWILKGARLALPYVPNTQKLDYSLRSDYIDQLELTHRHEWWGQEGAVRALVYQQSANMGSYDVALQHAALTQGVPDVTLTRQVNRKTWGYGLNFEQDIGSDWGVFGRLSWNPGNLETQTVDISRSWSAGAVLKGQRWSRPQDAVGVAMAVNGLSTSQIAYLRQGGLSPFIGDGSIDYKNERIVEAYYSYQAQSHLSFTLDVQRITNPAYNSARGPVNVIGVRAHFEM
jgi:high affinity Mn2+ porin